MRDYRALKRRIEMNNEELEQVELQEISELGRELEELSRILRHLGYRLTGVIDEPCCEDSQKHLEIVRGMQTYANDLAKRVQRKRTLCPQCDWAFEMSYVGKENEGSTHERCIKEFYDHMETCHGASFN